VDSDEDHICFRLEDGQLVKYVNGRRLCGGSDHSGVVTRLFCRGTHIDDQHHWGGRAPEDRLELLASLADRAGVPHNIFHSMEGSSEQDMDDEVLVVEDGDEDPWNLFDQASDQEDYISDQDSVDDYIDIDADDP